MVALITLLTVLALLIVGPLLMIRYHLYFWLFYFPVSLGIVCLATIVQIWSIKSEPRLD